MTAVRYTVRARRDLIDIWLGVSEINPVAADKLFKRIQARVEILRRFPQSGRLRPDIAPEARVLVEARYLILYRILAQNIQIVRVLHAARKIDETLFVEGLE